MSTVLRIDILHAHIHTYTYVCIWCVYTRMPTVVFQVCKSASQFNIDVLAS